MLFVLDHTMPNARYIRSLIHYCLLVVNCFWFLSTNSFCESFTLFSNLFSRDRLVSRFVVYLSSLTLGVIEFSRCIIFLKHLIYLDEIRLVL